MEGSAYGSANVKGAEQQQNVLSPTAEMTTTPTKSQKPSQFHPPSLKCSQFSTDLVVTYSAFS